MAEEHYLGNPLLKKAYTKVDLTQEQVFELTKCSLDPVYFSKNYMKIVTADHGLQSFTMFPFQERMLRSFHTNRFNICLLPRQSGKPLSLKTSIPTPEGWSTIGTIKVGDKVLTPTGKEVDVVSKTETMYNRDCYKISFDNGEEIVADFEHKWEVNCSYWSKGEKILTTKEIFERQQKRKSNSRVEGLLYIEKSQPIKFSEKELKIDPYLLGLWLSDWQSNGDEFAVHNDDYDFYKTKIDVEQERATNIRTIFKAKDLRRKLIEYDILNNKHIPQDYLRSSYNDRLELLRGLMDLSGRVKKNSRSFEFYNKEYKIVEQVAEILATLGIKSRIRKDSLCYSVSFSTTETVFNLPRKIKQINTDKKLRLKEQRHYIHSIEKVDSVPVACIQVRDDEHLFLCGKSFIPTHNSTTAVSFLLHYAIFNDNVNIAVLANKASTARDILNRLQTGYENLPKWLQQGICSWNKGSMELENGSKIIAASTSASSVRGGTYNIIFLDEFAFVPQQVADNFMSSVYPTITSGKETKVIIVSCVTKDTYLLTDKGYRRIETLIDKDKTGAYITPEYTVRGNDKFYSSNIVVNQGRVPTNIIKTRYENIECSETHYLWAFKDGKYDYFRSRELSIGDYVAVKYNQQIFGNDDYVENTGEIINEELAFIVGTYAAQFLRPVGKAFFSEYEYQNKATNLIEALGFDLFNENQEGLTEKVLSWSKKNIIALLQGIFDCSSIIKEDCIKLYCKSRELARQIQLLLANLGILSTLDKHKEDFHLIEIFGNQSAKFIKEIGFNSKERDLTNTFSETYSLCEVEEIIDGDLIWLKIKDIEKSENEVFDVSLPDIEGDKWAHSVLYNNFLGHQTPNGLNQFYKLWDDAIKQKNKYIPTRVYWYDVPGRDDSFKEETIANMGQTKWDAEFECDFLGSSDTLISGSKLSNLVSDEPIKSKDLLDIYEEPQPDRVYLITVDVAEGVELDYSAFIVFDVSQIPYKVVAKYRNNDIPSLRFPDVIEPVGKHYNNAYILCEVNNDSQVANILHLELDYPNILQTKTTGRGGQIAGQNFSGKGVKFGIKMSKPVKRAGCLNLKTIIEEDKLIFHDRDIINELSTFVSRYNSFSAEEGKNDDLAMCLVLFAWACTQDYFKEMTETDIRKKIREEHEKELEENDTTPFGFITSVDNIESGEVDSDGVVWFTVEDEDYSYFWNYNY
jgi:hypothetical protein